MLNGGAVPLQVPDLAQRGPDPASFVQQAVLTAAGIEPGGTGIVEAFDGNSVQLQEIGLIVVALPPNVYIIAAVGLQHGSRVVIPWHAVAALSAP